MRWWLLLALTGLVMLFATAWLNDAVTLEGHWSLYTVRCEAGEWRDHRCTGRLLAAERYDYVATRQSQTVRVDASGPTPRNAALEGCRVSDGRTWSCRPTPSAATITFAIDKGVPTALADGHSFMS